GTPIVHPKKGVHRRSMTWTEQVRRTEGSTGRIDHARRPIDPARRPARRPRPPDRPARPGRPPGRGRPAAPPRTPPPQPVARWRKKARQTAQTTRKPAARTARRWCRALRADGDELARHAVGADSPRHVPDGIPVGREEPLQRREAARGADHPTVLP